MGVAETPEAAALLGLRAGMDVDLYADDAYALLPKLVAEDPSLMPMIDRSAGHVLRTKFILGLFDDPYIDVEETRSGVRTAKALEIARQLDEESIILLKNDGGTLPLKEETGPPKIALLGPVLNDSAAAQMQRVFRDRALIIAADKGWSLTNKVHAVPSLTSSEVAMAGIDKLEAFAKTSDVIVLYLGGDEHTSKEGFFRNALGDRASIDPVGPQDVLVERMKQLGKPLIVVLKHRRTLSINAIAEHADAILDCWDLSEFGDEAVAKVILGDVSPSGKTPVTVPRTIGQLPFHYSGKAINNRKGYLFMDNGPIYPFGHGLSYGNFEYSNLQVASGLRSNMDTMVSMALGDPMVFKVEVSNNSDILAKEVVQLYLTDEIGSVLRPAKELKAFQKITLSPRETQTVTFTIDPDELAFTGLEMKRVIEKGYYTLQIGGSSEGGLRTRFYNSYSKVLDE